MRIHRLIRHTRHAGAALALCTLAAWPQPATARAPRDAVVTPPTDAELMHQAVHACRSLSRHRRPRLDLNLFARLLELERAHGVPAEFRGMTLAKACIESGYTPRSTGDCRSGRCQAVGIIQLWPWTQRFGVDRTDPVASVRFLLERVQAGVGERLHRICPQVRTDRDQYQLAWLRINRGPLRHGRQRCEGTPHGLRRLRQWQRNIAAARRDQWKPPASRATRLWPTSFEAATIHTASADAPWPARPLDGVW